jgi:hypothetical protein
MRSPRAVLQPLGLTAISTSLEPVTITPSNPSEQGTLNENQALFKIETLLESVTTTSRITLEGGASDCGRRGATTVYASSNIECRD